MPTEGFKSITVKEEIYWKLKELSARKRMKIAEFLEKLVKDFEVAEI